MKYDFLYIDKSIVLGFKSYLPAINICDKMYM